MFVVVVVFTLLQGPTLPWAARRLKVITPAEPMEIDVEAAPLEAIPADLLQAQIPPGLQAARRGDRRAAAARRGERGPDRPRLPRVRPRSRHHAAGTADRLLVVAAAGVRERTERRLRAVSRGGRLGSLVREHGP